MVHHHDLVISCSTLRRAPISDRNFQFHAKSSHKFRVNTDGAIRPDEEQLAVWRRGVVLEDGYRTAPTEARLEAPFGKGAWLRMILREGKKRQIREVGKTIGLPVVKIIRIRIGTLQLGKLKPREWRYLSEAEVAALKESTASKGKPRKGRYKARKSEGTNRPRRTPEKGQRG